MHPLETRDDLARTIRRGVVAHNDFECRRQLLAQDTLQRLSDVALVVVRQQRHAQLHLFVWSLCLRQGPNLTNASFRYSNVFPKSTMVSPTMGSAITRKNSSN